MTLPRDEETGQAPVPPRRAETLHGLDDDGAAGDARERLFLTWFVESGDTDDERTSFIDGVVPLEDALENEWTPAGRRTTPRDTSRAHRGDARQPRRRRLAHAASSTAGRRRQ